MFYSYSGKLKYVSCLYLKVWFGLVVWLYLIGVIGEIYGKIVDWFI